VSEHSGEEEFEEFQTAEGVYSFVPVDEDEQEGTWSDWPGYAFDDLDDDPDPSTAFRVSNRPSAEEWLRKDNTLYHDGSAWWVTYAGKTARLGDLDGILYLSYALEKPGAEGVKLLDIEMAVHGRTDVYSGEDALDAEALVHSGGFDDEEPDEAALRVVSFSEATSTEDQETLAGYRYALQQLKSQMQDAREQRDHALVQYLSEEKKLLEAELRVVENRTRRGPENEGPSKSHTVRVRNAINYARNDALSKRHAAFAQHLQEHLICASNRVIYNPPECVRWRIERG
jgi:hypothetical protein